MFGDSTAGDDDDWSLDAGPGDDADLLGDGELAHELKAKEAERSQQELAEAERREKARKEAEDKGREARKDVRVDAIFPLRFRIDGGGPPTKCRTRDLSATGFAFSTRRSVEKDMQGNATLELPDWTFQKPFVVRFMKPIVAGYRVGVQFTDLTDDERDRLARVVFDVQREQLRSGK